MPQNILNKANFLAQRLRLAQALQQSPARLVILGFMFLIAAGTALLKLPAASGSAPVDLVDALFTATSAVCVTGLTVVDTATAFSRFGQWIILVLVQAGGLGIMTLSTLFLLLAGQRPGLTGQFVVQDTYTHSRDRNLADIVKEMILFTIAIEALGAVVLFLCFSKNHGTIQALRYAVFHSVSAFCNAGFSLFSHSLTAYRESWMLNLAVCFLVVSGGLGFLVLSELKKKFSFRHRTWHRLSLHSKIVLSSTAALIVVGTGLVLSMEHGNTLAPLTGGSRMMAAFFQSVTARTAGFNTLSIGSMANETLFVLMLLMFIGASPGSCGGGIKTTSFATLVVMGVSNFRGRQRPQLFGRTISDAGVRKAVRVVILSLAIICFGTLALLLSEIGSVSHLQSKGKFLELLFEVVSAFGTVGLSTGATGSLTALGKFFVTAIMFIGRLGPLVVGAAISRTSASRYYYAEENIMVG